MLPQIFSSVHFLYFFAMPNVYGNRIRSRNISEQILDSLARIWYTSDTENYSFFMDSILDKVLSSKEDQEKKEFDPLEVVNTLLRTLSAKEYDILRRRFGLDEESQEKKETLETIGALYNVTRERIRQIEALAIKKVKTSPIFGETIKHADHLITSILQYHGGILTKTMLLDLLLSVQRNHTPSQHALRFIVAELLDDKIEHTSGGKKYLPAWKLRLASMDFIDRSLEAIETVIAQIGEPCTFERLYAHVQKHALYTLHHDRLHEDAVQAFCEVSARIGRNPFDEYGLMEWGFIAPKRMHDRVYIILKKEGKPMHFEDIAKRVTKIFDRPAYPPTVHNELILNEEYVLVGRGIYALKEWGFKEGVVADVLCDMLRRAGKPLLREELVDAVLQERIVKKNTIHLALTDGKRFRKTADGKYTLVSESPTA